MNNAEARHFVRCDSGSPAFFCEAFPPSFTTCTVQYLPATATVITLPAVHESQKVQSASEESGTSRNQTLRPAGFSPRARPVCHRGNDRHRTRQGGSQNRVDGEFIHFRIARSPPCALVPLAAGHRFCCFQHG